MSEVQLQLVSYERTPTGVEVVSGAPTELRGLHTPDIYHDDLVKRFDEANDTYEVITGPSGRRYEKFIMNADKLKQARVVKPSTSFSSGYKNPANVMEIAL